MELPQKFVWDNFKPKPHPHPHPKKDIPSTLGQVREAECSPGKVCVASPQVDLDENSVEIDGGYKFVLGIQTVVYISKLGSRFLGLFCTVFFQWK